MADFDKPLALADDLLKWGQGLKIPAPISPIPATVPEQSLLETTETLSQENQTLPSGISIPAPLGAVKAQGTIPQQPVKQVNDPPVKGGDDDNPLTESERSALQLIVGDLSKDFYDNKEDYTPSDLLDLMRGSVTTQESGGKQKARNPDSDATGLFQVMPDNIPSWTKTHYGKRLTQKEFADNKEAQIAVFNGEMGKYLGKALRMAKGDKRTAIRMAAAAWYGGEDDMKSYDNDRPQMYKGKKYPSFREYTNKVADRILKGQVASESVDPAEALLGDGIDEIGALGVITDSQDRSEIDTLSVITEGQSRVPESLVQSSSDDATGKIQIQGKPEIPASGEKLNPYQTRAKEIADRYSVRYEPLFSERVLFPVQRELTPYDQAPKPVVKNVVDETGVMIQTLTTQKQSFKDPEVEKNYQNWLNTQYDQPLIDTPEIREQYVAWYNKGVAEANELNKQIEEQNKKIPKKVIKKESKMVIPKSPDGKTQSATGLAEMKIGDSVVKKSQYQDEVPENKIRVEDEEGETYIVDTKTGDVEDESLSNIAMSVPFNRVPVMSKGTVSRKESESLIVRQIADQIVSGSGSQYGVSGALVADALMKRGLVDFGTKIKLPDERIYTETDASKPEGEYDDHYFVTRRELQEIIGEAKEAKTNYENAAIELIAKGQKVPQEILNKLGVTSEEEIRNSRYEEYEMAKVKGQVSTDDFVKFKQRFQEEGDDEYLATIKATGRVGLRSLEETKAEVEEYERQRKEFSENFDKMGALVAEGLRSDTSSDVKDFSGQTKADKLALIEGQNKAATDEYMSRIIEKYGSAVQADNAKKELEAQEKQRQEYLSKTGWLEYGAETAKSFGRNLVKGVVSFGLTEIGRGAVVYTKPVVDLIDSVFGTTSNYQDITKHPIYKAAGVIDRFVKETVGENKAFDPNFPGQVGSAIGSSIGLMFPSLSNKPKVAIALYSTAAMGGSAYEEALANGASQTDAQKYALLSSGLFGWTEILGAGKALQRLNTGKGAPTWQKIFKDMLKNGAREGGEEMFLNELPQTIGANWAAEMTFDPERKLDQGLAESLGTAGFSGGVMSTGVTLLLGLRKRGQIRRTIGELRKLPDGSGDILAQSISEKTGISEQSTLGKFTEKVKGVVDKVASSVSGKPITERQVTIDAQLESVFNPDLTGSIGILITDKDSDPEGLEGSSLIPVKTDKGTLYVHPDKVPLSVADPETGEITSEGIEQKIKTGELTVEQLIGGKAKTFEDTSGGLSVVTVDQDGNEYVASKISDATDIENLSEEDEKLAETQKGLDSQRFGNESLKSYIVPTDEIVNARVEDRPVNVGIGREVGTTPVAKPKPVKMGESKISDVIKKSFEVPETESKVQSSSVVATTKVPSPKSQVKFDVGLKVESKEGITGTIREVRGNRVIVDWEGGSRSFASPKTLKVARATKSDRKSESVKPTTKEGAIVSGGEITRDYQEKRLAEERSVTDELTGISNRRALDKALPRADSDPNISVISFDANNFGKVNKEKGNEAGDQALIEVAQAISSAAKEFGVNTRSVFTKSEPLKKSSDEGQVFRRGGDEFVVIAPKEVADKIAKRAEEIFGDRKYGSTTVSLTGVTGNTFEEADSGLQEAKNRRKESQSKPNETKISKKPSSVAKKTVLPTETSESNVPTKPEKVEKKSSSDDATTPKAKAKPKAEKKEKPVVDKTDNKLPKTRGKKEFTLDDLAPRVRPPDRKKRGEDPAMSMVATGVDTSISRMTHLADPEHPLPDSQEFKDWFGKSTVKQVVFHSTDVLDGFDTFRTNGTWSLGAHFGTLGQAHSINYGSNTSVIPVYIKAENPLRLVDQGSWEYHLIQDQLRKALPARAFNDLQSHIRDREMIGMSNHSGVVQRALKDQGYDSVVYLNRYEDYGEFYSEELENVRQKGTDKDFLKVAPKAKDSYIVFDANQIKSPFNNGNFSPSENNISMSRVHITPPYTLTVLSDEKLQAKKGGMVKRGTIEQLVNQPTTKQIEKSIIKSVLDSPMFKGEKSFSYDLFLSEVQLLIMPLQTIPTSKYADYGNEGADWTTDSHQTYIYNSPYNHGVQGHFSTVYSQEKKNQNWVIKDVLQEETQRRYFIAIPEGKELNEANLQEEVGNVSTSYEVVEAWIKEIGNSSIYNSGLFGHTREWNLFDDGEQFRALVENQSDFYQGNNPNSLLINHYNKLARDIINDRAVFPEDATKEFKDFIDELGRVRDRIENVSYEVSILHRSKENQLRVFDEEINSSESTPQIISKLGETFPNLKKLSLYDIWEGVTSYAGIDAAVYVFDGIDEPKSAQIVNFEKRIEEFISENLELFKQYYNYEDRDYRGRFLITRILSEEIQRYILMSSKNEGVFPRSSIDVSPTSDDGRRLKNSNFVRMRDVRKDHHNTLYLEYESLKSDYLESLEKNKDYQQYIKDLATGEKLIKELPKHFTLADQQFIAHKKNFRERMFRESVRRNALKGVENILVPYPRTLGKIEWGKEIYEYDDSVEMNESSIPYEYDESEGYIFTGEIITHRENQEDLEVIDSDGHNLKAVATDAITSTSVRDILNDAFANHFEKLLSKEDILDKVESGLMFYDGKVATITEIQTANRFPYHRGMTNNKFARLMYSNAPRPEDVFEETTDGKYKVDVAKFIDALRDSIITITDDIKSALKSDNLWDDIRDREIFEKLTPDQARKLAVHLELNDYDSINGFIDGEEYFTDDNETAVEEFFSGDVDYPFIRGIDQNAEIHEFLQPSEYNEKPTLSPDMAESVEDFYGDSTFELTYEKTDSQFTIIKKQIEFLKFIIKERGLNADEHSYVDSTGHRWLKVPLTAEDIGDIPVFSRSNPLISGRVEDALSSGNKKMIGGFTSGNKSFPIHRREDAVYASGGLSAVFESELGLSERDIVWTGVDRLLGFDVNAETIGEVLDDTFFDTTVPSGANSAQVRIKVGDGFATAEVTLGKESGQRTAVIESLDFTQGESLNEAYRDFGAEIILRRVVRGIVSNYPTVEQVYATYDNKGMFDPAVYRNFTILPTGNKRGTGKQREYNLFYSRDTDTLEQSDVEYGLTLREIKSRLKDFADVSSNITSQTSFTNQGYSRGVQYNKIALDPTQGLTRSTLTYGIQTISRKFRVPVNVIDVQGRSLIGFPVDESVLQSITSEATNQSISNSDILRLQAMEATDLVKRLSLESDGFILKANPETIEFIMRVLGIDGFGDGMSLSPVNVEALIERTLSLKKSIKDARSVRRLASFLKHLKRASEAGKNAPVIYLFRDSLGEELFHRGRLLLSNYAQLNRVMSPDNLSRLYDLLPESTANYLKGFGYGTNKAVLVDEVAAKIGGKGEWRELGFESEDSATEWLIDWTLSLVDDNDVKSLEDLRNINNYVDGILTEVERLQNEEYQSADTNDGATGREPDEQAEATQGNGISLREQRSAARRNLEDYERENKRDESEIREISQVISEWSDVRAMYDKLLAGQKPDKFIQSYAVTLFERMGRDLDVTDFVSERQSNKITSALGQAALDYFGKSQVISYLEEAVAKKIPLSEELVNAGVKLSLTFVAQRERELAKVKPDLDLVNDLTQNIDRIDKATASLYEKSGRISQSVMAEIRESFYEQANKIYKSKAPDVGMPLEDQKAYAKMDAEISELKTKLKQKEAEIERFDKSSSDDATASKKSKSNIKVKSVAERFQSLKATKDDIVSRIRNAFASPTNPPSMSKVPVKPEYGKGVDISDNTKKDLIDYGTFILLDGIYENSTLTLDDFDAEILTLAPDLSEAQIVEIHYSSMDAIKSLRPSVSVETKAKVAEVNKARRPHYSRMKKFAMGIPSLSELVIDEFDNTTDKALRDLNADNDSTFSKYRDEIGKALNYYHKNYESDSPVPLKVDDVARFIKIEISKTNPKLKGVNTEVILNLARAVLRVHSNAVSQLKQIITEASPARTTLVEEKKALYKEIQSRKTQAKDQIRKLDRQPAGFFSRLERLWAGFIISRLSTAVANEISARGVKNALIFRDVIDLTAQKVLGSAPSKDSPLIDESYIDILKLFTATSFIGYVRNRANVKEFMTVYPSEMEELMGDILPEVFHEDYGHARKIIEMPLAVGEWFAEKALKPNTIPETKNRVQVVMKTIDSRLKSRGTSLNEVLEQGNYDEILPEDWETAIRKARYITAALNPEKGTVQASLVDFWRKVPIILGNPFKFARVIYNITKFSVEHNPFYALPKIGYKALKSYGLRKDEKRGAEISQELLDKWKVNSRDYAQLVMGTTLLGIALALQMTLGDDDKEWDVLRIPFTQEYISIGRFQPFASFFFTAKMLLNIGKGKDAWDSNYDLLEAMAGMNLVYNPYWNLLKDSNITGLVYEMATGMQKSTPAQTESAISTGKQFLGGTLSTPFTPLTTLKLLAESMGIEKAFEPDYLNSPLLTQFREKIPFIPDLAADAYYGKENVLAKIDPITGDPQVRYSSFGRLLAITTKDPLTLKESESVAEQLMAKYRNEIKSKFKTEKEKEIANIKYRLTKARRLGKITDEQLQKRLDFYVENKTLKAKEAEDIMEAGKTSRLIDSFNRTPIEGKRAGFNVADEKQKVILKPLLEGAEEKEVEKKANEEREYNAYKVKMQLFKAKSAKDKKAILDGAVKRGELSKSTATDIIKESNYSEIQRTFEDLHIKDRLKKFSSMTLEEQAQVKKIVERKKGTKQENEIAGKLLEAYNQKVSKLPPDKRKEIYRLQDDSAKQLDATKFVEP